VEERGKKKEGPEPLFDNLVVAKYMDHVDFVQKVKVTDPTKAIDGEVYYMSCNSERCIPPNPKPMSFTIGGGNKGGSENSGYPQIKLCSKIMQKIHGAPGTQFHHQKIRYIGSSKGNFPQKKIRKIHSLKLSKMEDGWHIYSNKIERMSNTIINDWEADHYKLLEIKEGPS
jgi:hypothetical protein